MGRAKRNPSTTPTKDDGFRFALPILRTVWKIESDASASLRGAKRRSNPSLRKPRHGLLRGACHRARIRATRWLAMTLREQRGLRQPHIQKPAAFVLEQLLHRA